VTVELLGLTCVGEFFAHTANIHIDNIGERVSQAAPDFIQYAFSGKYRIGVGEKAFQQLVFQMGKFNFLCIQPHPVTFGVEQQFAVPQLRGMAGVAAAASEQGHNTSE
tara:strand:+ start:707 stop:1030 length:324 start_codon:yes stop_codon:yes gene_type:complete